MTAALTWRHPQVQNICQVCSSIKQEKTPLLQYLAGAMWLINAIALVALLFRMRTILDVWLVVTLFVSLPDLSLSFSSMPSSATPSAGTRRAAMP